MRGNREASAVPETINAGTTVCRIDDLIVDFTRRKVFDGDHNEIALSALSFDTLKALIEAAPAVLTTEELINRAWRGSVVSDETVTQRIRLLRKALHDDRRQPRYIETLRNVGYRLIPPVSTALPVFGETRQTACSRSAQSIPTKRTSCDCGFVFILSSCKLSTRGKYVGTQFGNDRRPYRMRRLRVVI